jgi:hypothetical protein
MENETIIKGNKSIIIQGITDSTITVVVNGQIQEIQNELAELKALLQKNNTQTFQNAEKIYNIGQINEANFGFVTGKRPFNEVFTKKILIALSEQDQDILKSFDIDITDCKNWETNAEYSNLAKEIISSSYVGILGKLLVTLFAIGKVPMSEAKQQNYIDHCIITSKTVLQLLCYTLISELWNLKKVSTIILSKEQADELRRFFDSGIELNVVKYFNLLFHVHSIYKNNNLTFPITELTSFEEHLQCDSEFNKACVGLHEVHGRLTQQTYSLIDCFDAEKHLTTMFAAMKFFATYKMVSIRKIGYDEMRNNPPQYLHNYIELKLDHMAVPDAEDDVKYVGNPISTDTILLYKDDYQKGINLFPFIIDHNALNSLKGTKICLYMNRHFKNKILKYKNLDKDEIVDIVFKNTKVNEANNKELMKNAEKRKEIKLDEVYLQLEEAKKAIVGCNE